MAYAWENVSTATLRVSVGAIDGEISGSAAVTGTKSVSFGTVDNTAPLQRFIDGTTGTTPPVENSFGLFPLFLTYLLGASYFETDAKKTVTIGVEEVES